MPIYVYRCEKCGLEREVLHSISEIDNPSEETLKETSCVNDDVCKEGGVVDSKERFIRVPQAANYGKFASMTPAERKVALKKRSREHYKKVVAPQKRAMDRGTFGR